MEFLLDPNVAYLILLAGVIMGFLALVTPGTGLFEIGAFFCIVLAGYVIYSVSFNGWALFLLVLSIIPFIYSIQKPKRELYLGISILLMIVGSVFIFPSEETFFAVNPFIAFVASAFASGFIWVSVRKSMEAAGLSPIHDLGGLLGKIGEARTMVHEDGSVQVGGELWSAKSEKEIPVGSPIRVVRRDGFIVIVEKVSNSSS